MISRNRWTYLYIAAAIVLMAFLLRTIALLSMPLFLDEGLHIQRAFRVVELGRIFDEGLDQNKWLYPVVVGAFNPGGPESPYVARYVSALFSTLTVASCIALGHLLDSRKTGLAAGILYAVVPFSVFHERQALVDPMMTALAMVSVVILVQLFRKPRIWLAVLLGLCLALAYLTKLAAVPYFGLPLVAALLLNGKDKKVWNPFAMSVGSVLGAGVIVTGIYRIAASLDRDTAAGYELSSENVAFNSTRLAADISSYAEIMLRYVGPVLLVLVVLCIVWVIQGKKVRSILFLAVPALGFAVVPVLAQRPTDQLVARYIFNTMPAFVTLAALSWIQLLDAWRNPRLGQTIGTLMIVGIVVPSMWFFVQLTTDPGHIRLTTSDESQYQGGSPSGFDDKEIAARLLRETDDEQFAYVIVSGSSVQIRAYLGPRRSTVNTAYPDRPAQLHSIARRLSMGERVFIVENQLSDPLEEPLHGTVTRELMSEDELVLYEVIAAEGTLANVIPQLAIPEPEAMSADYEALAGSLGDVDQVLVFPDNHGGYLNRISEVNVNGLDITLWPLTQESVGDTIDAERSLSAERVGLVLVDEANSDPQRTISLAMLDDMYRLNDSWFGLLHYIYYISGPSDPDFDPVGGVFEDAITLETAAIIDAQTTPAEPIRVALQWSAFDYIEDPYHVFVHVIDEEGNLWAQHDGEPGNSLLSMTSWEPQTTITDRFAIQLPADIPAGEYTVRVGIYAADSGLRLRVSDGGVAGESGADFVYAGSLRVGEGG